jgi:glutathione S-transferase
LKWLAAVQRARHDHCVPNLVHSRMRSEKIFEELLAMKLMSSPLSPYGRKVKIAAGMKGLTDKIELLPTDTNKGDDALNKLNPLGKIPCLITDDGEAVFDSHVICEYFDVVGSGPELFPKSGAERWRTLTAGALADGILDAALLLVYEGRFRPENMKVQAWVDRQQAKIDRSLAQLEKAPPAWKSNPDYGHLTLACALGYLDFRHGGKWRAGHPKLVKWLDEFAAVVPAFEATRPS